MADRRHRQGSWVNRYLNKVLSVQGSIDKLLHFGFSRSFRPYLAAGITLRVNVVKSHVRPIPMPQTAKEWDFIVRDMAKHAPISLSRDGRAALCGQLRLKTPKGAYPKPWSLHCEIALAISYGMRQKAQGDQFVKPVRYIGVSKLSCLPCYELMEILKEKEIGFYTRGCHGKT